MKEVGAKPKAKEIQVKIKFTATRIDIVGAVYSIRVGHTMHRYIYSSAMRSKVKIRS